MKSIVLELGIQVRKHLQFRCPGCKELHILPIEGNRSPHWTFNGDTEKPTLTPSVLAKSGHYADPDIGKCWCTYEKRMGKPAPFKCGICHSWVRDGRIQFLSDSTHELAGQTVDLPDLEPDDL